MPCNLYVLFVRISVRRKQTNSYLKVSIGCFNSPWGMGRGAVCSPILSKISSRFDYFAWSMRWGNASIESDLRCINPLTHSPEGFYQRAPNPPPPPQKKKKKFLALLRHLLNPNVRVGKIYHMRTKFGQRIPF